MNFNQWCERYGQNPRYVIAMLLKNFNYNPEYPGEIGCTANIKLRVIGTDRYYDPVYGRGRG